jgi:uncharacterized protein (TIGR02466 family)
MQITPLFPTPLIRLDIADRGLIAELRQIILEREAGTPGATHSNDGGWQSTDDFAVWSGAPGALLIAAVRETVKGFTGYLADGEVGAMPSDWRIQAWANVNRSGAGNHAHFHPGAFWSACFYVDDGGIDGSDALGGAIEFADPRGALPLMYAPQHKMMIAHCLSAGLAERVYPKTGTLLVFPAWLAHSVTRYTGSGTRISLTINFCL